VRVLSLTVVASLALATGANASEPSTSAEAERLEAEGAFSRAGEVWEVLSREGDRDSQILAAYMAQKAYRAATTEEPEELCRAHAVVAAVLMRDDLDADERADFEAFAAEIEKSAELDELCQASAPPFLPVGTGEIPDEAADEGLTQPPESRSPVETRSEPRRPGRRLQIAGAVLLGSSAGLLGLATYGLVEDYQAAREILSFAPKNASVGLTEGEIAELRAAQRRAEIGSQIAIGAGVGAGVVVLTGAVLLGVGTRRRTQRGPDSEKPLALTPEVSRNYGGLALRGRF